jgi:hypothetical protein
VREERPGTPVKPDLCTWMRESSNDDILLSMLVYEEKLWYVNSLWPRISKDDLALRVSLDEVLEHNKAADLTLRTKRILAVLLAHALVQLRGSPFMREEWDRSDIYFVQRRRRDTNEYDIRGPYICTSMNSNLSGDTILSGPVKELAKPENSRGIRPIHPCPSLLNLGILLLEVESGSRFESQVGNDKKDPNSKAKAALEYVDFKLKYEKDDLYPDGFWETVRSCLDPKFIPQGRISDHDFIREAIRENIVMPLEIALWLVQKVEVTKIDKIVQDDAEVHLKYGRGRTVWIEKSKIARTITTPAPAESRDSTRISTAPPYRRPPVRRDSPIQELESGEIPFDTEGECALFDEGSVSQDPKKYYQ